MKGIILEITVEEFKAIISSEIQKAIENYTPVASDTIYKTRRETAIKLHISLPTLNEYTKSGKLKAYRINGRVLYKDEELDAALTAVQPLKYRRS